MYERHGMGLLVAAVSRWKNRFRKRKCMRFDPSLTAEGHEPGPDSGKAKKEPEELR